MRSLRMQDSTFKVNLKEWYGVRKKNIKGKPITIGSSLSSASYYFPILYTKYST